VRWQAACPESPPEGRYRAEAGLLARGSQRRPGLPGRACPASDTYRPPLAAYSCGGSAGLGLKGRTGFPS